MSTYINSGNVIFSAAVEPHAADMTAAGTIWICCRYADRFRRNSHPLQATLDEWTNDAEQKSDVVVLFPDIDTVTYQQYTGQRPVVRIHVIILPGAIITNISRNNQPKFAQLGSSVRRSINRMTIRNREMVRSGVNSALVATLRV